MQERQQAQQIFEGQWVRPGGLDRRQQTVVPPQPATAATLKTEMDARFRVQSRQMGGDEITTGRIHALAVHNTLINQYDADPWTKILMQEAVEDNHREARELHRYYMRQGTATHEETFTTQQTRQQRSY
jgi:hypothetical protein